MRVDSISTGPGIGQTSTNTSHNGEPRQIKDTTHGMERRTVEDKRVSEEDVIHIIEKANKDFIIYDRRLEFSIHDKTKQIMVKIIDVSTDEVIKELPPEKILDMVAGMLEVAGIIVDRKV